MVKSAVGVCVTMLEPSVRQTFARPSDSGLGDFDGSGSVLIGRPLKKLRLQCYLALVVIDTVSLIIGFALAGFIASGSRGFWVALDAVCTVIPLYGVIALYSRCYSTMALSDAWAGVVRTWTALAIAVPTVLLIAFYMKASEDLSRLVMGGGTILAFCMLLLSRRQMRQFIAWRCGPTVTNTLIINDGGPLLKLRGAIEICAREYQLRPDLSDPVALDRIGLALRRIDRVAVSCPVERRHDWAMALKGANVEGEVLDDEVAELGARGATVSSNGRGLLQVAVGPLGLRDRLVKRAFDLAIAGTAVVVLLPLLVAIAFAIKLEDGGPVFFVQTRMGRGNCFFRMFKFRSMLVAQCDGDGTVSTSRNDPRVTQIGRLIRSTSIDELPQLFNVLLGDMSIVGPRPHAIASQAGKKLFWEIDWRYWQRHSLKPGLSGLAQVRGFRGATDHEDDLVNRLQADLEYLEGWSIMRDIKILFLTLGVLFHDRAY